MAQAPEKLRRLSAYALIINDQRVLLSKLNHGPAEGKWNLVGGGIQHGEDPLSAVVREIKEESGLTIEPSQAQLLTVLSEHVIHQLRHSKHAPGRDGEFEDFHLIGIIYLVRLDAPRECKADGDGDSSDGCRWFSIDAIRAGTVADEKFVTFVGQALALVKP